MNDYTTIQRVGSTINETIGYGAMVRDIASILLRNKIRSEESVHRAVWDAIELVWEKNSIAGQITISDLKHIESTL